MSDYTGLRAQFLKTALTPDAPCKFHIPSQPVHTANLAMNLVPMIDHQQYLLDGETLNQD